jgi:hypothetical protein
MKTTANCSRCGKPVSVDIPASFAGDPTAVFVAACPDCDAAELLEEGGRIAVPTEPIDGAVFPIGEVHITPGAAAALADARQGCMEFVARHVRGDWGGNGSFERTEVDAREIEGGVLATDRDDKLCKIAILTGRGTVHSRYRTAGRAELWVMTELAGGRGETTVMLADEY